MSENESITVWPFTEHQIQAIRGLFYREIKHESKVIDKIGMTSAGDLIMECIVEGQYKTFSISRKETRESNFEKYFKPEVR